MSDNRAESSRFTVVIFGATGDLTRRKLNPALFNLHATGVLPSECNFVAVSRTDFSNELFKAHLVTGLPGDSHEGIPEWHDYSERIHYFHGSANDAEYLSGLDRYISDLGDKNQPDNRLYYLALSPTLYESTIDALGVTGMLDEQNGIRRLVVEKPFGTDLESAHALNEAIHKRAQEHQLFRIDHYLGKDTVQNLLVFRFGNTIFEPIWNRNYVDHVQISALEDLDVGERASYYEKSGVLRDMFQSHVLQLLTLVAMEPPATSHADSLRDEKAKVLSAVRRSNQKDAATNSVRGQYRGYRELPDVSRASSTATYGAVRLWVDNWRWQGVPFYMRSGKNLKSKYTEVSIQFRQPPHRIFDTGDRSDLVPNMLRIVIQPNESIRLTIDNKKPGPRLAVEAQELEYRFPVGMRDAYERLLLDAVTGDASLFTRADEIELSWSIVDPFVDAWETQLSSQLFPYEPGSWGPEAADQLIGSNRAWSNPF